MCSIIHQIRALLNSLSNAVTFIFFSTGKKLKERKINMLPNNIFIQIFTFRKYIGF